MKPRLRIKRFRKDIEHIINHDPVIATRFVLLDTSGATEAPSWAGEISWPYSWAGSWRARIEPLGRETWFAQITQLGDAVRRSFILLMPYDPNCPYEYPKSDDHITIESEDGENFGTFRVNMLMQNDWKVECNVELIAPGTGRYG